MGCCNTNSGASQAPRSPEEIRRLVAEGYARVARGGGSCCGGGEARAAQVSGTIGYSEEELAALPAGANLGLGCGNPTALDSLKPGEVVLDLGSGAGIDAFLAARQVGSEGRVIGVDMTDEMLERARANARAVGAENVEFRKGLIEKLPVESNCIDVIISNCVINLSPEKERVFREAFRVLKPGGRLMLSDVVLERPLPEGILRSADAYVGCVGGAWLRPDYLAALAAAGFREIRVESESAFGADLYASDSDLQLALAREGFTKRELEEHFPAIVSIGVTAYRR
jgi:SAM-dependent methyltransferase